MRSKEGIKEIWYTSKSLALDYSKREYNAEEMDTLKRKMYILLSVSTAVCFLIMELQRLLFLILRDVFDDPMGLITSKCVHSDGSEVKEGESDFYILDSKMTNLFTCVLLSLPI